MKKLLIGFFWILMVSSSDLRGCIVLRMIEPEQFFHEPHPFELVGEPGDLMMIVVHKYVPNECGEIRRAEIIGEENLDGIALENGDFAFFIADSGELSGRRVLRAVYDCEGCGMAVFYELELKHIPEILRRLKSGEQIAARNDAGHRS